MNLTWMWVTAVIQGTPGALTGVFQNKTAGYLNARVLSADARVSSRYEKLEQQSRKGVKEEKKHERLLSGGFSMD